MAGGAGTVLTFLPVLMVFFAALALFEDTGYLAHAAYVTDRFMHLLGLHGKSFLPLFLGFGCNVPAIMGARVIQAPAARLLTILLAPFVPLQRAASLCSHFSTAVFRPLGARSGRCPRDAELSVLAFVGVVFNQTVFKGCEMPFIMELPLYHVPTARGMLHYV